MEKLVTNRLTYFVEKHNILNNVQCGFRKGRSTVDHIIRLQDAINKYNHNKGFTVGVFIDFQSAFDDVAICPISQITKSWDTWKYF